MSNKKAHYTPSVQIYFYYHLVNFSFRSGLVAGLSGLVLILAVGYKAYKHIKERKMEMEYQQKVEQFLENYKSVRPTRYSYNEIRRMTDNFKTKLGQGGYGSVFKGQLPNGVLIAVKLLGNSGGDGDEFINEVGTIGRIHHVNIVRLVGFSVERCKRALIYEFMPNESLEKFIFSNNRNDPSLDWKKVQEIAIGIARGIEYLHQGCDQRILHFDIKPHNILLDENMNPKISDFGLAKLCSKDQSVVSMTAARGTMGYIAPEVLSRNFGNVSYKSDIFSFGMLLLEMVGGRKNLDIEVEQASKVYFPQWIYHHLVQDGDLGPEIGGEGMEIAKKLTIAALWCIQWNPVDRPSMRSVVQMLESNDQDALILPPNPFDHAAAQRTENVSHIGSQLSVIAE